MKLIRESVPEHGGKRKSQTRDEDLYTGLAYWCFNSGRFIFTA